MALYNANDEFLAVDIGESERNSDGGALANSNLGIAMEQKLLSLPNPRRIPGTSMTLLYVL